MLFIYFRWVSMAGNPHSKGVISLFALFVVTGVALFFCRDFFEQEAKDPFIRELGIIAGRSDRDITKVVNKYISAGVTVTEATQFLADRGFKVEKTKPGDWHDKFKLGEERYHAYRSERRNIIILTTADIILISDGVIITKAYGKINLTGF